MKKAIFAIARYLRFLRVALRSPIAGTLRPGDWRWVLRGYQPETVRLLDLTAKNHSGYMRDIDKKRVSTNTNEGFSRLFNNKIEFQFFFENIFPLPRLYCVILDGRILPGSPNYAIMEPMEALEKGISLVFKPVFGGMGRGICFASKEGTDYVINGEPRSEGGMAEFLSGLHQYMVCERIEQHPSLRKLFPGTINTLRVLTVRDPGNGEIGIELAVQRIGTTLSFPTDTFGRGGLGADIDLETGTCGVAVRRSETWSREAYTQHPDSGEQITGKKVPHWEEIRGTLLEGLSKYPYFDYVGWDVLVAENGFYVIEGNHNPSNHLMQVHEPLLASPLLRRFYVSRGILKRETASSPA